MMLQTYTTTQERRVGFCQMEGRAKYALLDTLAREIKHGYESIRLAGRQFASSLTGFYPVLLLLAEAAIAARGYLIWPSIYRSPDEQRKDDWFMNLDL